MINNYCRAKIINLRCGVKKKNSNWNENLI